MGFAALRALGMRTGMSSMTWFRKPDGSAAIADVVPRPPSAEVVSLMSHAHGADMNRAWANAVVNGMFTPIPRLYAAGAALVRTTGSGSRVVAVEGLDKARRELGNLIVEERLPMVGAAWTRGQARWIVVRHAETSAVESALERLTGSVRIQLG
jgi:hypothetical protein